MNAAPDHRQAEARRLAAIRGQFHALGQSEWQLGADGEGMLVDTALDGDRVLLCRFGAHATSDEMQFVADAKHNIAFLLSLVDRAVKALRRDKAEGAVAEGAGAAPDADRIPNYAAEAAIKCAEPAFRVFLEERHGLERPLTDDKVAARLRSLLGVTSRRNLNSDEQAAARWKDIRREFEAWRKLA